MSTISPHGGYQWGISRCGKDFHSLYFDSLLAAQECAKRVRPGGKSRFGSDIERLSHGGSRICRRVVGPSKPRPQQAKTVGDLVFSQRLRQGCAPGHDRICSALQLRRRLQGREMISRIQAGAYQRHPSLVTIVCALCSGAADPDNAGDLLLATRRSKNERALAAHRIATTWPL